MTHSTYFYVLFLWAMAITDFRPLEIYKNLGFPLFTITFTANSHANNHLLQIFIELPWNIIQYEITFFINIYVKVFYIQIRFKYETQLLFFLITMVYRKSFYRKKVFFFRLCKNYWITCCTHVTPRAIWVHEITGVIISIKKTNKN